MQVAVRQAVKCAKKSDPGSPAGPISARLELPVRSRLWTEKLDFRGPAGYITQGENGSGGKRQLKVGGTGMLAEKSGYAYLAALSQASKDSRLITSPAQENFLSRVFEK